MCSVKGTTVRGHVPTITNPVSNYGHIVNIGGPGECPSYVAMILCGQSRHIMPVHRWKRPYSRAHTRQQCGIQFRGRAKNLPVKDLQSTSRKEIQKIKAMKTPIAIWRVRTLYYEGQLDLLLDELEKFNIDNASISETHWCSYVDVVFKQNGYTIIYY